MPSPQPVGSLKRPPIIRGGSSSSSLSEMDQSVRSFQEFIKQTALVLDSQKPWPPSSAPQPRRASSSPRPRSRSTTPSEQAPRRSSSIYSRSVSQWDLGNVSWRTADFADGPLLPIPVLHPLAYSASTPHLTERLSTPPPLLPRSYSPLIATPSPATSRGTTPSSPRNDSLAYFPGHIPPAQSQKTHVRTVSLEEAIAAVHGPGAVHLLPEELRAKKIRRSRSDEALRWGAVQPYSSDALLRSTEPHTLVDNEGRRRTIISPKETRTAAYARDFPTADSGVERDPSSFKVGYGSARHMVPLATSQRDASREKAVQALGLDEFDEPRGRTRHRGPRRMDYAHYLPTRGRISRSASRESEPEAQKIAKEYHALLTEQYRNPSNSPAYHSADSDEIKAHMRLIPQPLFQAKPPGSLPGHLNRSDIGYSSSPHSWNSPILRRGSISESTSDGEGRILALKLSQTFDSTHQRRSTSGSIPISPPQPMNETLVLHSAEPTIVEFKKAPLSIRRTKDTRASAYYPHVASRKGRKAKSSAQSRRKQSDIPPMPFLSNDVEEQKDGMSENSRKTSNFSSYRTRQHLHQRVAKYADLLTKPELPERQDYQPITSAIVAPGSPHLMPSPATSKSKEVHLGWSEAAKSTFDKIVSPGASPTKALTKGETALFTHVVAPARPLDESKAALRELESPRRKSSIFGGFLESWKESKAEKRRGELKKMIRFVPNGQENAKEI